MTPSHQEEQLQLRAALGITLIVCGALWLLAATVLRDWVGAISEPYLVALVSRSIGDLYRLAMMAAVAMVIPHALWVTRRGGKRGRAGLVGPAYERVAQLLQSLFTSFGFLGTIIGVSIAVSGLESAMESRNPTALIGGLGTAFDTTFLGLCGAILVTLARRFLQLSHRSGDGS